MGAFVSQKLGEGMKLGTPAGDLERQARRLERQGYREQAGKLRGEAALWRAENKGFSSSERNITDMRRKLDTAQMVVNEKAKTTFGDGSLMGEARAAASPNPRLDATPASRLDASPTPGLDATAPTAPVRESFAQEDARKSREASLAGTFGPVAKARAEKSENLEARQSLFAEMRKAKDPGSPMFRRSAESIGLTKEEFDRGLWKAVGGDTPRNEAPATAVANTAPRYGADVARKNIAEQGIQGAAADYFARKDADVRAGKNVAMNKAFAKPVSYQGGQKPMSTTAPAAPPGTNPVRAAAPTQPTSVLSGVNDLIASADNDENYGGSSAFDASKTWRGRRDMGYLDRAREQNVSVAGLRKISKKVATGAGSMLADIRAFSESTNKWAEEFRNRK
jgi:hypothetical protein